MKACSITGCDGRVLARGLCMRHYESWRNYGDPLAAKQARTKGSGTITKGGYLHKRAGGRRVQEHILIAEKVLGKPLPDNAQVHHANNDRLDNSHANLVICQDQAYHSLLHVRQRAMDVCGNPNFRACAICREYGDPAQMAIKDHCGSGTYVHRKCRLERQQQYQQKRRSLCQTQPTP